jgi:hypothetical protein
MEMERYTMSMVQNQRSLPEHLPRTIPIYLEREYALVMSHNGFQSVSAFGYRC